MKCWAPVLAANIYRAPFCMQVVQAAPADRMVWRGSVTAEPLMRGFVDAHKGGRGVGGVAAAAESLVWFQDCKVWCRCVWRLVLRACRCTHMLCVPGWEIALVFPGVFFSFPQPALPGVLPGLKLEQVTCNTSTTAIRAPLCHTVLMHCNTHAQLAVRPQG